MVGARIVAVREAAMTAVLNLILFAGLVLVPLGFAMLFIRLSRRFRS
jgi:hypothetical protein